MKKLTKSRNNKVIFGVCGGLAEYLNMDATIIRLIWFLLSIPSFGTLGLAYLICGFIIPDDDGVIYQEGDFTTPNKNSSLLIGIGLLIVGSFLLIRIIYPQIRSINKYWPILLIFLGLYILINNKNKKV